MSNFQLADLVVLVQTLLSVSLLCWQVLFLFKHIQSANLDPRLIRRVEALAVANFAVIGMLFIVVVMTKGMQTMAIVLAAATTTTTIVIHNRARHIDAPAILIYGANIVGQVFVLTISAVEYLGR